MNLYGLFLKDYEIKVRLGVHDFEKAAPQRVRINVALAVEATAEADAIETVLDYDFLRAEITLLAAQGHIGLQETLCAEILKLCRARTGVRAVRVSTEKPDVYPDCAAVGCRMAWIDEGVDPLAAQLALGV